MKTGDSAMAATLFVLLGEETSAEILRHLTETEIESISRAISGVGPTGTEQAEKAAEDLYQTLVANRFVSEGGVDYAKKVILRTLGAGPAKRIMDRLSSSYASSNAFEAIDRLNPIQLSQFIQNEHRFKAEASCNDLWLEITLRTPRHEESFVYVLHEILSQHYKGFQMATIIDHPC